jgi:hypothetical protein
MAGSAQSYKNTLIFAIVASLLTVGLLAALVYIPSLQDYFYIIVTIEIGLIVIIVNALWSIISYDKRIQAELRGIANNGSASKSCPDYYTAVYTGEGSVECRNAYIGQRDDTPMAFSFTSLNKEVADPGTMTLGAIFDNKTVKDVCMTVDPSTSSGNSTYSVPWTEVRPKCTALAPIV